MKITWQEIIGIAAVLDILSHFITGISFIFTVVPPIYNFVISVPYLPPILTLIFGLVAGLYLGFKVGAAKPEESDSVELPNRVKACLEINDVLWKARADLSGLSVSRLFVEDDPYCPKCNTKLDSDTVYKSAARRTNMWVCANCDYQTVREDDTKEKAERIVERHFRQITTNKDKDYSYDNLAKSIRESGRTITGESIWEEYVKTADDDERLSTECFV